MEISIDEKVIQEALDSQATKGIQTAFEGYAMRNSIEKAVSESFLPTVLSSSLEKAASSIDIDVLTKHLSKEMARSITKGVQAVIQETMVNIIMDLKKIPSYDNEARESARMEILAKVF